MTERPAFTRDVLLHRAGECPTCDAASADHHPALAAKTRTMQHRAGHCVTCDAALKDHTARSLGPPDDSDRFSIGPPPPLGDILGAWFTALTLVGVGLLIGFGAWGLWRCLR